MTCDRTIGFVLGSVSVVAAGADTARALLTTEDAFVANQSPFDRQARLQLPESAREVTPSDYLRFVETQVRTWSDEEVSALEKIIASIAGKFGTLTLALPDTVYLVKTSGAEEGFAAYTRGEDTIVLPETKVSGGPAAGSDSLHPADVTGLENIVIHEFFHLLSKNNPQRRHLLYGLVNYKQFDEPVPLPDTVWRHGRKMADFKITNPDTPRLDVAIRMPLPGSPDAEMPMMPVLLASGPYESGLFFDYLEWWFLVLEESGGRWQVKLDGRGMPVMVPSDVMMPAYLRLVGRNIPHEIFHPDEVLAQTFVLVMNEPGLDLLQKVAQELTHAP